MSVANKLTVMEWTVEQILKDSVVEVVEID